MRVLFLLILFVLSSCSEVVESPKNLLSEKEMSSLIAEFAISNQMSTVAENANQEIQTRYILKKYNIKAKDFQDSYVYYIATNSLNKIFDDAQDIIIEKDPKAKDYIKNKLKKSPLLPAMGR